MFNQKNYLLNCDVCDTRKMKEEDNELLYGEKEKKKRAKKEEKIKRKKQIIHRNICLKTVYIIIEKKRKNRTFWRNWNLFRKRV